MNTALKSSITKLDQAVNKLESVIEAKSKKAAANGDGQIDMFGAASPKSNDNGVDTAALASKLDSVIDKVEKILQEG